MLAILALAIFGTIFLLSARFYKKPGLTRLVRITLQGTKRISSTTASIAAVFVLVQLMLCWAADIHWANQGLLFVERTLSFVRFVLKVTTSSPYFLLATGILLMFLNSFQLFYLLPRIARKLLRRRESLMRWNLLLTIATSLTFFGTGTKNGLANIEASLVEDRTKVERGLRDLEKSGHQVAELAIVEVFSEIMKERKIQQKIAEITNYDEIVAPYPFIKWPHARESSDIPFDSTNTMKSAVHQVSKTIAAQASLIKSVSEIENRRPHSRQLPVRNVTNIRATATLDRIQRVQAELEDFIHKNRFTEDPPTSTADAINQTVRLSISAGYDYVAKEVLPPSFGSSALSNIFGLFLSETVAVPLKEMLHIAADHLLTRKYVDSLPFTDAYAEAKQLVKPTAQRLYNRSFQLGFRRVIDEMRNERQALENLVSEKSDELSFASRSARNLQIHKLIGELSDYGSVIPRNSTAKSSLNAFIRELSQRLHSVSAAEAIKQIKWVESQVKPSPQVAGTLKRVDVLTEIESRLKLGRRFKDSIDNLVSQILGNVEHEGKWGDVRSQLEEKLTENKKDRKDSTVKQILNQLKYGLQIRMAKEILNQWHVERRRIALAVAFDQSGQSSLTPSSFESAFAEYLRRSPKMTALWGYAVIAFLNDGDFTDFEGNIVNPPTPRHGYLRYVRETGIGKTTQARTWLQNQGVNTAFDMLCSK